MYAKQVKRQNIEYLEKVAAESWGLADAESTKKELTEEELYQAFTFFQESVDDRAAMEHIFETEEVTHVCHLAARAGVRPSLEAPEEYIKANVEGTAILMQLAAKKDVKNFVYASSSSVYGERASIEDRANSGEEFLDPFKETDPADSQISPYAATKRMMSLLANTNSDLEG